jgi:segregation and condensation protein A
MHDDPGRRSPDPAAPVTRRDAPLEPANGSGDAAAGAEGTGPRVTLDAFEGPLDLLLHLIREEQVDITDIPIARITEQYLATLGDLEALDLDHAGEYLVMAAELMRIKARLLLPREGDEEDEEAVDPRAELARRLLEYREFKGIAEDLAMREEAWRGIFRRAAAEWETPDDPGDGLGVSLMDLFRAFQKVLDSQVRDLPLEMEAPTYSVDDQIAMIRRELGQSASGVPFVRLFEGRRSRSLLIATFLALLELVRLREIFALQAERFGEIWLKRATEDAIVDAT